MLLGKFSENSCQKNNDSLRKPRDLGKPSVLPESTLNFAYIHTKTVFWKIWTFCGNLRATLIHTTSIFISKCRPTVMCFFVPETIVIAATQKIAPFALVRMTFHLYKFLVLHVSYLKVLFHWYLSSVLHFCFFISGSFPCWHNKKVIYRLSLKGLC